MPASASSLCAPVLTGSPFRISSPASTTSPGFFRKESWALFTAGRAVPPTIFFLKNPVCAPPMNSGNANKAAIRLILWATAGMIGLFAAAYVGYYLGSFIKDHPAVLLAPWALFLVAVLFLFRDPDPIEPSDPNAIVSPAH